MAQYETVGSATIEGGDSKIQRKVVISTDGADPEAPGGEGRLTSVSITAEAGGIRRGVFEYTQAGEGSASYDIYGKRVEVGSCSSAPIETHKDFKEMTVGDMEAVHRAADARNRDLILKTAEGGDREPNDAALCNTLYEYLDRQVTTFLAPSAVGRISEIESNVPSFSLLGKVSNPSELSNPYEGDAFWLLTSIQAMPIGEKYEVTREYTLVWGGWSEIQAIYGW
jgi:hypothetical protein